MLRAQIKAGNLTDDRIKGTVGVLWRTELAQVAEVDQHAVAHVLRYEAAEALDSLGDAFLRGRNDLVQVLRVYTRRQCCRTDEVGEHHR